MVAGEGFFLVRDGVLFAGFYGISGTFYNHSSSCGLDSGIDLKRFYTKCSVVIRKKTTAIRCLAFDFASVIVSHRR